MRTNSGGNAAMHTNPIRLALALAASAAVLVFAALNAQTLHAQQRDILPLPSSGSVTLSLDEYNRLITLAARAVKKPEGAPLNYAIQHADLKLRVTTDSVLGSVQLEGETYTKNSTKVALTNGMTILDARQDGKLLPLQLDNGMTTAVLLGSTNFSVALDAGLPLGIEAGRASFNIPVPSAGSARLSLVVPGDQANVRIAPGLITNRSSANGQTFIEATLVPGQTASVWWTTREVVTPTVPREARFLSSLKTLFTVSESDLHIAALADITVVQGDPAQFALSVPAGYEVTSVTGPTLESSETPDNQLILNVTNPAQRSHEFLISLEKSVTDSKADAPFLAFINTQRETGEALIEGSGTMELTSKESGSLKRMDVKEVNPYLRALSRFPLQAAFRYHRQPGEPPALALAWTRFPDSSVLAAVAERAVVTTLVTVEGKSLTEVKLTVKNQAQPFLKVGLPTGASIVSAEVAGEKVKPVQGSDGSRVPLLRPGFRPNGAYEISFVFLHSGAPFAKKGGSDLSLPKMDVPIDLLQWEVFLPQQYKVKDFGGDAFATSLLPRSSWSDDDREADEGAGLAVSYAVPHHMTERDFKALSLVPGQIGGMIVDPSGAVVSNAHVTVVHTDTGTTLSATTDSNGRWVVSNVPSGRLRITASSPGFKDRRQEANYDASRPLPLSFSLNLGSVSETVEVATVADDSTLAQIEKENKKRAFEQQRAASANVTNLQQRVAGVLPVAVDVPRAGNSYRFVRPLVLDEETKVSFTYKTK
jgi:Carboxypeptidase regulatory-like domain